MPYLRTLKAPRTYLRALVATIVFAFIWWETASSSEFLLSVDPAAPSSVDPVEKSGAPRIAIVVLPGDVEGFSPADREKRLSAIAKGWGGRGLATMIYVPCVSNPSRDGAFSLFWNVSPSRESIGKFGVLRDVLQSVARKVDPDFLLIIHDHALVITENLLRFVKEELPHPSEIVMTGSLLKISLDQPRTWFVSEPAGMLISRATLHYLIGQWREGKCIPELGFFTENPSHALNECFFHAKGGNPWTDSREGPQGYERFNVYGPVRTVHGDRDDWYKKYKNLTAEPCCAVRPITFHYVDYQEGLYWDRLLHGLETGPFPAELGGYSMRPPGGSHDKVFTYMQGTVMSKLGYQVFS